MHSKEALKKPTLIKMASAAEEVSPKDLVMVPKSVWEAQFGEINHKVPSTSAEETLDLSSKDLELIPLLFISRAKNLKNLDLSKNNIFRFTNDLWELPLREINLSYNKPLGTKLVSILTAASKCITLNKILLRGMRKEGCICDDDNMFFCIVSCRTGGCMYRECVCV